MIEDRLGLAVQLTLMLGVLGIGTALGTSWGLIELQQSCIAAGKLPQPGATLVGVDLDTNACWQGAQRMQTVANVSGGLGAALLLGGGVLDTYGEEWLG